MGIVDYVNREFEACVEETDGAFQARIEPTVIVLLARENKGQFEYTAGLKPRKKYRVVIRSYDPITEDLFGEVVRRPLEQIRMNLEEFRRKAGKATLEEADSQMLALLEDLDGYPILNEKESELVAKFQRRLQELYDENRKALALKTDNSLLLRKFHDEMIIVPGSLEYLEAMRNMAKTTHRTTSKKAYDCEESLGDIKTDMAYSLVGLIDHVPRAMLSVYANKQKEQLPGFRKLSNIGALPLKPELLNTFLNRALKERDIPGFYVELWEHAIFSFFESAGFVKTDLRTAFARNHRGKADVHITYKFIRID